MTWRQILRQNFTHVDALADYLELSADQRQQLVAKPRFILNLPLRLAQKIAKRTLEDPILRQFVPLQDELIANHDFVEDPVNDKLFRIGSKLLSKYQGRVLLVSTSACAMHCRYCFRQNFDYESQDKRFDKEIERIAQDPTVHEVILSGGDPLSLSDDTLNALLQKLSSISHITRIRFHTRFPIGIPERISPEFLKIIAAVPKQVWFVIHANHPLELDLEVLSHLKQLQQLGCPVVNQAVLLRGVNDQADVLKALCERCVDHGIMPYYLHQLDRVQGAAHFEVSEKEGHLLIQEITKSLPGYAVPKYVREIAGESSKTIL